MSWLESGVWSLDGWTTPPIMPMAVLAPDAAGDQGRKDQCTLTLLSEQYRNLYCWAKLFTKGWRERLATRIHSH